MSSAYEKSAVQNEKISDSHKNLPIEDNKVADTGETENIDRKTVPEKLPIENYAKAYSNKAYNEPTINNLTIIYDQIEVNQVFGSAYIIKILDCSDRTARNLLAKLREMEVIVPVKGKGKGMYRFKYADEMEIDGEL